MNISHHKFYAISFNSKYSPLDSQNLYFQKIKIKMFPVNIVSIYNQLHSRNNINTFTISLQI